MHKDEYLHLLRTVGDQHGTYGAMARFARRAGFRYAQALYDALRAENPTRNTMVMIRQGSGGAISTLDDFAPRPEETHGA